MKVQAAVRRLVVAATVAGRVRSVRIVYRVGPAGRLSTVWQRSPSLSRSVLPPAVTVVCRVATSDSAPAARRREVEAQVRQYVRRHAADPDLAITGIAGALGWSARYLQDVLQAAGTTSRELIRSERLRLRLRLARTRLAGSAWDNRSIAQVAHASGFASHASFATAYRREFGVTPRETRGDGRGES
ncbi:helix-turn-helix domain-containing protein [Streptomyces sp. NPDC058307]|uniref:helix-turn-helix domain-containing protein n=1 Tax=Streptomyces sp. NPDC058307 TaxID=3346439 RepID=UPI0036E7A27A